jgi:hypothetical protein
MYNAGYRYYVYCGPGHIKYFTEDELSKAQSVAKDYDTEVKLMD